MKKQIREITLVDIATGEELNRKVMYSNKYSESFIMFRTTEGLDWYFALTNNEKNLLLLLHGWSDYSNMRLSIAVWQREEIMKKLGVRRKMISVLLKGLEDKDCLIRLSQNDFMINPSHVFKCSASEVRSRMKEYEETKKRIQL